MEWNGAKKGWQESKWIWKSCNWWICVMKHEQYDSDLWTFFEMIKVSNALEWFITLYIDGKLSKINGCSIETMHIWPYVGKYYRYKMPSFSSYEAIKCVICAKVNYEVSQFQSFVFTNRYCKMAEKEISCDMKCNRCIISRSMLEYAS